LYVHTPTLFNANNYRGNTENVFPNIAAINVLCIPKEKAETYAEAVKGLQPMNELPSSSTARGTGWACIVRLGGLGDDLIAASVLKPLKDKGYKIDVIAQDPAHVVFENNPYIDKLSIKKVNGSDLPQGNMLAWHAWFESRAGEYDLLVNLSHTC